MADKVQPVPEGYSTVTPYLIVKGAAEALDFYNRAFGATETMRMQDPGSGQVMHAEMRIGDSNVMLADEHPDMGFRGPQSLGGTAVSLVLYVANVDDLFKQALSAGAKEMRPVQDQFYGDRMGTLQDPYGHVWSIATHIEDVSPEEMRERAAAMSQGG
ncbi:MAG: VOC family protein [Planctomycetota bacterium]|nr:MAG: VOC family protein [Planctomycetota bacterium]